MFESMLRDRHAARRRIIDAVNGGDYASFLRGGRIEPDKLSHESRAILRAAADMLLAAEGTEATAEREPDGWVTIFDTLHREVVFDKERADAQRAQGYRVRPFYFGPPAPARTEEATNDG